MASTSRGPENERPRLKQIKNGQKAKPNPFNPLARRLTTTLVALALLGVMLKYLPAGSRNRQVQAAPAATAPTPADLHFSDVQISQAPAGEVLYVDGVISNRGSSRITGAAVEVSFRDSEGSLVATLWKPIQGMAHGGADVIQNEFTKNPMKPNEMRFFRVAVEQIPPKWNHEVPELKVVAVTAQ